jgi:hypothetical protein
MRPLWVIAACSLVVTVTIVAVALGLFGLI